MKNTQQSELLHDLPDRVEQFVVGPLSTNCYAYISQGHALVIDPGASGKEIAEALTDCRVDYIVATHGHGDHVGGVAALQEMTHAKFCIVSDDEALAQTAGHIGPFGFAYDADAPQADLYLHDHDILKVGTACFEVILTPGHTPGSCILLGSGSALGIAFVGDTLFQGSAGRCDLDGGDSSLLAQSLAHLKEIVPPDTQILSGHGPSTFMDVEIQTNPYLR